MSSLTATLARADLLTHSTTIPLAPTNWAHVALLPRFNPALGTLEGVSISLTGHIEGTARYENLDSEPAVLTIDFTADLKVRRPDTNAVLLSSTPAFHQIDQVAAFDGTIDFAGTSGETYNAIVSNATSHVVPPFPLDAADMALFVGAGNAVFNVSAVGNSIASGSGNLIVGFTQSASAVLTITYTYTPPFIQDCNNNGIVDSIDIASQYEPGLQRERHPGRVRVPRQRLQRQRHSRRVRPARRESDRPRHDGYPDQCTCVRVDRNKPASLLLWPEFDNRPGQTTLVTITNTNGSFTNGAVRVEFRYIDGTTCLETNRTAALTPNDTLTVDDARTPGRHEPRVCVRLRL